MSDTIKCEFDASLIPEGYEFVRIGRVAHSSEFLVKAKHDGFKEKVFDANFGEFGVIVKEKPKRNCIVAVSESKSLFLQHVQAPTVITDRVLMSQDDAVKLMNELRSKNEDLI